MLGTAPEGAVFLFILKDEIHAKMRTLSTIIMIAVIFLSCTREESGYTIVIHGGAGNITREKISVQREQEIRERLDTALQVGTKILSSGGSSIDAVESVIRILEDSPLFNAGKGAVFNNAGQNELDASIMEGKNLNAGGVTGVHDIRNPISAARKVMEESPHVLLMGEGASIFARVHGLVMVDPGYFRTERRWEDLQRQLKKDSVEKYGTVGCVALDMQGNLAAGTSTGGMTNKKYGRIGDSPIIGAGNYANNRTCAVSGTGHGELFIRYTVAHDISALMEYRGLDIREAARQVIQEKLLPVGGMGGVICVDHKGRIAMEYNTAGMIRAWASSYGDTGIIVLEPE